MCVWNNKFLEGIRLNTQSQSQNMNSTDIAYLKLYGNKIQWHLPEVWFGGMYVILKGYHMRDFVVM